ncbi:alpha/beta fold hydrolase [Paenibacillus soyae]|uniref:Alpha/beta hydrolase n=1 Tax=Paenibacillus soyae TaxID=2969249 RepID=A0A9X2S8D7_9BACL|nr:alpha/beta hydrolase [Paenibacillus soyae]MCR2802313.1 alpha/beta hydrolase [Paenibacillus soyae]
MIRVFKSDQARRRVLASYDEIIASWGVEAEQRSVMTRYGITHCCIAGSPQHPPLFLLHGVGDNSAVMWALNMKELSTRYYCIAIDTLGGPGKSVPGDRYKKGEFLQTEWLDEVIRSFDYERISLAGVSNGAYMAFRYATVHPERVNKVVCIEGGIVTSPLKAMLRTMGMMFPEILFPTERSMLRIVRKLSSPSSDVWEKHEPLARHLVLLMKTHNANAMFPHELVPFEESQGQGIRDKLLFLIGEHSRITRKAFSDVLDAGRFRYERISNAGHGVNHEQPEAFQRTILQFLE